MILGADSISDLIKKGNGGNGNGITVVPKPDLSKLKEVGEASLNLRLGRWFLTLRQSDKTHLDCDPDNPINENKFSKQYFVPFGESFILHPNRFVLASTVEWVRLPSNIAAMITGKSSVGRRGIIIETAAGIHPGFSGCLTLEITNVGEVPIRLLAGMLICQLFFSSVKGASPSTSKTKFAGQRKPRLGQLSPDSTLKALRNRS